MFDFDGKVLLLTGAASGIGRATAEYFWRCGARLVLVDLNEPALAELSRILDPQGQGILTMRYDAAQADDAQALVDACMQRCSQLCDGRSVSGDRWLLDGRLNVDAGRLLT